MTKRQKEKRESEVEGQLTPSQRGGYVYSDVMQNKHLSANVRLLIAVAVTYPQHLWKYRVNHLCDVLGWERKKYFRTVAEAKRVGLLHSVNGRYEWNANPYLENEAASGPEHQTKPDMPAAGVEGATSSQKGNTVPKKGTENSSQKGECPKREPLSITNLRNITKGKDQRPDPHASVEACDRVEPNQKKTDTVEITTRENPEQLILKPTVDPITAQREKDSAEKEKAEREKWKHWDDLKRAEVEKLYKYFLKQSGLDGKAMSITVAHRKLAYDRFNETAKMIYREHKGKIAFDDLSREVGDAFENVIDDYLDTQDKIGRKKTWSHMCSVDSFRAGLMPKPERRSL